MSETEKHRWLPQFCSMPTLFALMVVAEIVALVIAMAPDRASRSWLGELAIASVFVQWLALLNAVVLCSSRESLQRLPVRTGFVLAWLLAVVTTALGSAVVYSMDHALGFGLTAPVGAGWRFCLGNAAICALIAAALLRYLYIRELWQERVHAAAKAQVDALQARIRPHFLFNSMNTIASLIRKRPRDAERAVEDLSDLFRAALGARETLATLGEELDLIGQYLRIESLRLGDRLKLDLDLDALPRELPLPPLLLQPLVENAVYHGIQRMPDGGTLRVRGARRGDLVEIVVHNPVVEDVAHPRNAHALANVRARIEYHFGARGELLVQPQHGEFTVTVRLPDGTRK
ncbi:histidine kinase [Dokdonella sp.]|uniref:sensor histidine kinase n=1 Tax=Dokdonella sp. TaxID=2291710 RepID=UPI002B8A682C|nr:histidine kinase [Dokdonella sp.]HOX71489.1 histidine kinase [Dokdonella sp.]HPN78680.1 histidine kinase [Dokdonella sp.]